MIHYFVRRDGSRYIDQHQDAYVRELMEELILKHNFKSGLTNHVPGIRGYEISSMSDWTYEHRGVIEKHGIDFYTGYTKVVISAPSLGPWVIKVDRISQGEVQSNHCNLEANVFMKALSENLDRHFSPMFYLCTIGDVDIYLQEKVSPLEEDADALNMFVRYLFKDGYGAYDFVPKKYLESDGVTISKENIERFINNPDMQGRKLEAIMSSELRFNELESLRPFFYRTDYERLIDFFKKYEINDVKMDALGVLRDRIVFYDYSGVKYIGE